MTLVSITTVSKNRRRDASGKQKSKDRIPPKSLRQKKAGQRHCLNFFFQTSLIKFERNFWRSRSTLASSRWKSPPFQPFSLSSLLLGPIRLLRKTTTIIQTFSPCKILSLTMTITFESHGMCSSRVSTVSTETLTSNFIKLTASAYTPHLSTSPSLEWDPNQPSHIGDGVGAVLVDSKDGNGSLRFNIVAYPEFTFSGPSGTIVGLADSNAFVPTKTFDLDGILNGLVRFSVINFKGHSPPNMLHFCETDSFSATSAIFFLYS